MAIPKHSRPFNIEHAKAGAPYLCLTGDKAYITKWDARGVYQLLGTQSDSTTDWPTSWHPDGKKSGTSTDLVMTPLGFVEGEPVFVGDVLTYRVPGLAIPDGFPALPTHSQTTFDAGAGCIWPAPAKPYPKTKLTEDDLYMVLVESGASLTRVSIANAALKHAIDCGQVVVPQSDIKEAVEHQNMLVAFGCYLQEIYLTACVPSAPAYSRIHAISVSAAVNDWLAP